MRSLTNHFFLRWLLIGSIGWLYGCSADRGASDDTVIAKVAGSSLTIGEAKKMIPDFVIQQDTVNAIQSFANQWIQEQVSLDHARRIGIQNSDFFHERMRMYEDQLLIHLLKQQIMENNRSQIEVSDEEALTYYQAHREQLTFDEKYVRFRLITTLTRDEAESANMELENGFEWSEIVQRYSIDPELQFRQSTQFWPVSMAAADIPPVHQNLRTLGLSERSPIHYFGNHYHLVQLMDERTEEEVPDLEWLIPQIAEWLKLERSRRITNAYLRNLYLQADTNNEIELRDVTTIEEILKQPQ